MRKDTKTMQKKIISYLPYIHAIATILYCSPSFNVIKSSKFILISVQRRAETQKHQIIQERQETRN
jgi:cytochrome c-type biogenesis protein CcmH/NrfF